jgi:peptidoglycan/xylan/chitin deacetylase (PgdA/CDA1 family)
MTTRRTLLLGLVGLIALGGAYFGHKYYGKIKHALFGKAHTTAAEANDLYNPENHLFKRGRRDRNEVCLTIDDGPHPKSLPRILSILKKYNVKATFFMVGMRIQERPDLVREVLKEGHEVGNHTQNHPRLDKLPADQMRSEIAQCAASFAKATGGAKMTLFRPPGMRFTPELFKVVGEFGYTTVDWNYGAKDFVLVKNGPSVSGGQTHIADYILKNVTAGGIILLHDSPDTADALPTILDGLKQKGLAVKDVTEMLANLPSPVHVQTNAR